MRIVLASSSPRRKELMQQLKVPFEVISKDVDETFNDDKDIYEESMQIAKKKAEIVYQDMMDDVIVIGSDTIVVLDNQIYGKPKDYNEAFQMLKKFSGRSHKVISSLCLLIRKNKKEFVELDYGQCEVKVSDMTDAEINEWILTNDVYSKAGAYAIQEGFGKYIEKIEGDYFSIVGFPIHKLYNLLKKYNN